MMEFPKRAAHVRSAQPRTGDVTAGGDIAFKSFLLKEELQDGLEEAGFIIPSPIQLKAIPLGRLGTDLIAQAKSGTGKTCVFAVILLEALKTDSHRTQVLVLAPTREIALQIHGVVCCIGCKFPKLSCHAFIGGTPVEKDKAKLARCQVVVGTPGRIKALIECEALRTDYVRLLVLDEADKLFEEGSFQRQVNWINASLPEDKQVIALSATYPDHLQKQLAECMHTPTHVKVGANEVSLQGVAQYYAPVPYHPIMHQVFQHKTARLIQILSSLRFSQCLVFSNYQTRAEMLSSTLCNLGWPSTHIAGSQTQQVRQEAMAKLQQFQCRVLVTTDLVNLLRINAKKTQLISLGKESSRWRMLR